MRFAESRGMLSFAVFFILWYVPIVNSLFWNFIFILSKLVGVPLQLAASGYDQFLFWR
jgi:hypothetical protein